MEPTGRERLFFASDYFEQMYEGAVKLIQKGKGLCVGFVGGANQGVRGSLTDRQGRPLHTREAWESEEAF